MSAPCLRRRRFVVAAGVLVAATSGGVALWKCLPDRPANETAASPPVEAALPALDLADPQPSFKLLRHVRETGGDAVTRDLAMVWLDAEARRRQPLPTDREAWLLSMLAENGHPAWDREYRLWLFNSTFNNLQFGSRSEDFARLLARLVREDEDQTMRLYALQHLDLQHGAGRLTGELVTEILSLLREVVAEPGSAVAGTAVAMLVKWDGTLDSAAVGQALALASDSARPVDVRVTALHAVEGAALPLARTLAGDPSQPLPIRKAAIACIGSHGSDEDFSELQRLASESSRLAQAAEPALRLIRHRLDNPDTPAPIPF